MFPEFVGTEVGATAAAVLFAGTHHTDDATPARRTLGTILVVDNDATLRLLIAKFLVLAGYQVLEAPQGSKALHLAERHHEPIDLLLTDVVMPGLNGFELAEALGSLHPEAKVLYMTGHAADVPAVRQAFEADPSAFLIKPFWAEVLLEKIQSILPGPTPT